MSVTITKLQEFKDTRNLELFFSKVERKDRDIFNQLLAKIEDDNNLVCARFENSIGVSTLFFNENTKETFNKIDEKYSGNKDTQSYKENKEELENSTVLIEACIKKCANKKTDDKEYLLEDIYEVLKDIDEYSKGVISFDESIEDLDLSNPNLYEVDFENPIISTNSLYDAEVVEEVSLNTFKDIIKSMQQNKINHNVDVMIINEKLREERKVNNHKGNNIASEEEIIDAEIEEPTMNNSFNRTM